MSKYRLLSMCAIVVLIAGIFYWYIQEKNTDFPTQEASVTSVNKRDSASLRFSNTQTWDAELYWYIKNASSTVFWEIFNGIHLPPPPDNISLETQAELVKLHDLVKLRTPEKLAEIEAEITPQDQHLFGPRTFGDFTNSSALPSTRLLLNELFVAYLPVIMKLKEQYDRVRPHMLDQSLTVAIPVPGHPAYPSGHSSEAYLMAFVATELDPENKDAYFESAANIARNREIAGLHYQTDTEAGKMLAEQFFNIVKEQNEFKPLFENAKKEWGRLPSSF